MMVTGRQDSRLELHPLFSLRRFPERLLVLGGGSTRVWKWGLQIVATTKAGAP